MSLICSWFPYVCTSSFVSIYDEICALNSIYTFPFLLLSFLYSVLCMCHQSLLAYSQSAFFSFSLYHLLHFAHKFFLSLLFFIHSIYFSASIPFFSFTLPFSIYHPHSIMFLLIIRSFPIISQFQSFLLTLCSFEQSTLFLCPLFSTWSLSHFPFFLTHFCLFQPFFLLHLFVYFRVCFPFNL